MLLSAVALGLLTLFGLTTPGILLLLIFLNDETKKVAEEVTVAVRKLEDRRDHDEALNVVARQFADSGKFNEARAAIAEIRADEARLLSTRLWAGKDFLLPVIKIPEMVCRDRH